MTGGLILHHAGLLATVFLLVLNGHLRRSDKLLTDIALVVLGCVLWTTGFVFFGWKLGILALLASAVYAVISKPIAVSVARRIVGSWTTFKPPLISSAKELSAEAMRAHHNETARRLGPIAARPSITKVLSKNGLKAETLREQFQFLLDIGLGGIARDVISKSGNLDRLLAMRRRQWPAEKIAARLMRWR
jgi:hypothetical protein